MPSSMFRWKCSRRYLPRLRTAPWSARRTDPAELGARTPLDESAEVFLTLLAAPVLFPEIPDGAVFRDHVRECRAVKTLPQAEQSDREYRGPGHECAQCRRAPGAMV